MATLPSISTMSVGDDITDTYLASVKAGVDFFVSSVPIGFFVQQSAQTGWTSSTFTSVTFGTSSEVLDRDGQHSTSSNTSRVVIGGTLGWYRVSGIYVTPGNTATTRVQAGIAFNGSLITGAVVSNTPASTSNTLGTQVGPIIVQCTLSTDYVELQAAQTAASGTIGTAVSGSFASSLLVEWIGS